MRRERGIGVKIFTKIGRGSTRRCKRVLRTLMGQSLMDASVTSVVYQ